jgi:hypothetical protein
MFPVPQMMSRAIDTVNAQHSIDPLRVHVTVYYTAHGVITTNTTTSVHHVCARHSLTVMAHDTDTSAACSDSRHKHPTLIVPYWYRTDVTRTPCLS